MEYCQDDTNWHGQILMRNDSFGKIAMLHKTLKLVGPLHVVGGLMLFLSAFFPSTQAAIASLVTLPAGQAISPFFVAILGPTIASWGILFSAVVTQFYAAPSPGLWKALMLSVAIWAPLDTGLCLYFGVYGGAVVNTIVVVVLFGLLMSVRSVAYESGETRA